MKKQNAEMYKNVIKDLKNEISDLEKQNAIFEKVLKTMNQFNDSVIKSAKKSVSFALSFNRKSIREKQQELNHYKKLV